MVDWNNPTNLTLYSDVLAYLRERDEHIAKLTYGDDSNLKVDFIRFANNRLEKWDGAAWVELTATYSINVDKVDGKDASDFLPATAKGAASGVAPLDENTKIAATYLYSTVSVSALVQRTANQNIIVNQETKVEFDDLVYEDVAGLWDTGNQYFTIPAQKTKARVSCQVAFAAAASGFRRVRILKNGTVFDGCPTMRGGYSDGSSISYNLSSGWLNVTPGDDFSVHAHHAFSPSLDLDITIAPIWFSIEVQ